MKKTYKKIMISLLIIAMLLTFVPFFNTNALGITYSWKSALGNMSVEYDEADSITHNELTLTAFNFLKGATYGYVDLEVSKGSLENGLAGVSGNIVFSEGRAVSAIPLTEGWTITGFRTYGEITSFIAEKDDLSVGGSENLKIRFKYTVNENTHFLKIGIGNVLDCPAFILTDANNNNIYPCGDMGTNSLKGVDIVFSDEGPIGVAETANTKVIKIENENIYVKLDNENKLRDLCSLLDFPDEWHGFSYEINYHEYGFGTSKYVSRESYDNQQYDLGNLSNATSITFYTDLGCFTYNLYQMGNTWGDDVYVGGVINANDVGALRLAIIGNDYVLNSEYFVVENTDVNFSNSERGTLGDIGDVISIRQRILNNTWKDLGNN